MKEALIAQVISGFFGLATMALGTYLPSRIRRRDDREDRQPGKRPVDAADECDDPTSRPGVDR